MSSELVITDDGESLLFEETDVTMCGYCGERPAVATIEDVDPATGYRSELEVCEKCQKSLH